MMQYHEFKTVFEELFETPKNLYPCAVEYHQTNFQHSIEYLFSYILDQTETLVQQSKANWENTEEIISDVLYCADLTPLPAKAWEIPMLVLLAGLGNCHKQFYQVSTSCVSSWEASRLQTSVLFGQHECNLAERVIWLATETPLNL